jgi:hypothetical protein
MRMSFEQVCDTSPRMWKVLNFMAYEVVCGYGLGYTALGQQPRAGGRVSGGAVASRKGGGKRVGGEGRRRRGRRWRLKGSQHARAGAGQEGEGGSVRGGWGR